ncbi:MAG TPA: hypothetical protein VHB02_16735 [Acidimicrobiales bacterium]|nr:hypothetical protein [Acidimicrobiales bacterium]
MAAFLARPRPVLLVGAILVGSALATQVTFGSVGAAASRPATLASTATAGGSLAQWKAQYEPAIGQIADDVLVVYVTGKKRAKHPTKEKVQATIADCRRLYRDATKLPGEVPPIPLPSAEKSWRALVAASISGARDCLAALQHGSTKAAREFPKQLARANTRERELVRLLGGPGE